MKVALFGGTFNPIHYGHLVLAESAYYEFQLDKVIFIPSGRPPHKTAVEGSVEHRYNMTKIAIKDNIHFSISDYEIKKKCVTYTCDTIKYFKKNYPDWEIFFLIGLDLFLEIDTWKDKEKVLDLCPFLVGLRSNYPVSKIPYRLKKKVHLFKAPLLEISSTDIRKRIRNKISIKYLLPDAVEKYIIRNKLYI